MRLRTICDVCPGCDHSVLRSHNDVLRSYNYLLRAYNYLLRSYDRLLRSSGHHVLRAHNGILPNNYGVRLSRIRWATRPFRRAIAASVSQR